MKYAGITIVLAPCVVLALWVVLVPTQTTVKAAVVPLPTVSGVRTIGDVGIAAPTSLVLFTDPHACLGLGATKFPCYKAVQGGGLFLQWAWKQSCGHIQCLNADQFRIVRRFGGTITTQDRYAQLYDPANNTRGIGLIRGTWAVGDCFTVRALNLASGLQSADSNQVCVRLHITAPVVSPGPIKQ